jgi:dipeptidyl aminopeptidase/acylaminoacyl peptidase
MLLSVSLVALCATAAEPGAPARVESGNRITENVPEIPRELVEELQRYANTRSASLGGWLADGSGLLIGTRFANTVQVHRVKAPGGAREQLTFYDEPITSIAANPKRAGFVFGKDIGGSEFWQLFSFDLATRETRLLTDGKSRNAAPVWSHDGTKLAYSSTARNGTDTDVWVMDPVTGEKKNVVAKGGSWEATDFSRDGKRLLVQQGVSINDVRPGVVDLPSGELTMFPVEGGTAAFGAFRFSPDGSGAYFTSDEGSEFRTLRYHDFATNKVTDLSKQIPWNVEEFALPKGGSRVALVTKENGADVEEFAVRDDTRVAFVTNEDGIGVLHVIDAKTREEQSLPAIPAGVISGIEFSPDGERLAFALNSATSPSDVYTVDFASNALARWTESEVGGLDTSKFVAPTLVHFSSKAAKGKALSIPAFYYEPSKPGPHPVVVNIHGGPESQARPVFSADIQYLVGELGIAVLVPNVRGSDGYGKSYLKLDNGYRREDSVADIGALLDWIATRPELDAKRVAVYGGSYGGYMVLASMTHYNHRLRAGVDIVGISNFVTFLEHTESYRRDLRRVEYGDERDPKMKAFLARISPTSNAKNISIPLFVSAGANDPRVPASEGRQIADTVRSNGGDVWFLEFKDEGHGWRKKTNADYFRAATMMFWKKYLLDES